MLKILPLPIVNTYRGWIVELKIIANKIKMPLP